MSVKAGEAAVKLAANKRDKYDEITHAQHLFCPSRDRGSCHIGHLITKITAAVVTPERPHFSPRESLSSFSAEMPPLQTSKALTCSYVLRGYDSHEYCP